MTSGGDRAGPSTPEALPDEVALRRLHEAIRGCQRCVTAGLLARAAPVLPGPTLAGMVLVGQAPGRVEEEAGRPFSGRAGRQLFRWLAQAGLGDEETVRRSVYITSITKCFPGPAQKGSGDRRPSQPEVEHCRGHLQIQLRILRPWLILAVGQMAAERFLGPLPMHLAVGRIFAPGGVALTAGGEVAAAGRPLVLPLPHPSGASRWLNAPDHRVLLVGALDRLRRLQEADPRT